MDDQLVLTEQPQISRIISKETTSRNGRLDVKYKVAFVGYRDSEAVSYTARQIRCGYPDGDKLVSAFEASIEAAKPPPEVQPFTQEHWSQSIPPDSQQQFELVEEPSAAQASASPLQPFTQAPFANAAIPSSQAPGHGASGRPQDATAASSPRFHSPVGANGHAGRSSADHTQSPASGSETPPPAARQSVQFYDDLPSMAPIPGHPATRAASRPVAPQSSVTARGGSGHEMSPAMPPPAAAQLSDEAPASGASGFAPFWPAQEASSGVEPGASQGPVCNGGIAALAAASQARLPNGGLAAMVTSRQGLTVSSWSFPPLPAAQRPQGLHVQAGTSSGNCNRRAVLFGGGSPAGSPGNNPAQQAAAGDNAQAEIASAAPHGSGSPERGRASQNGPAAGASIGTAVPRSANKAGSPGRPPRYRQSASPAHTPQLQSPGRRAPPASWQPGFLYVAQPPLAIDLEALASVAVGLENAPASGSARLAPSGRSLQLQHDDEQMAANSGEAQAVNDRAPGSAVQDIGASQDTSPGRHIPAAKEHPGMPTPTAKTATGPAETAQNRAPRASGGAAQAAQLPTMSAARVAGSVAHPAPCPTPAAPGPATTPSVPSPSNQAYSRRVYGPGQAPGAAEWNKYLAEVLPQAWAKLGLQPGNRVPSQYQQPGAGPSTTAGTAGDQTARMDANRSAAAATAAPSDGADEEHGTDSPNAPPDEARSEQRDSPAPDTNVDDGAGALPPDVAERMHEEGWAEATIVGARTLEEGLDVHVRWSDGFDTWIYHEKIKEQMFRLPKLVEFYESKTKKRPKAPPQPSKRVTPAPAPEASSDKTETEVYTPSKRKRGRLRKHDRPQATFPSPPEARRVRSREADTGSDSLAEHSADESFVDAVVGTSSEDPAPTAEAALAPMRDPRRGARVRHPVKVPSV